MILERKSNEELTGAPLGSSFTMAFEMSKSAVSNLLNPFRSRTNGQIKDVCLHCTCETMFLDDEGMCNGAKDQFQVEVDEPVKVDVLRYDFLPVRLRGWVVR